MFGFLKRWRTEQCPNHTKLPPELHEAEAARQAHKLAAALNIAISRLRAEDSALAGVLERAEVYAGVEDLELNLAALSFPRTADANVHIMGYLWDWIDARDEEAMAEEIIGQVRAAVEAGELPRSADEFIGE
jgi:hypothetical protein